VPTKEAMIIRRNLIHALGILTIFTSIYISKQFTIAIVLWLVLIYIVHLLFKHHPKLTTLTVSKFIDKFSHERFTRRLDFGPIFFGVGLVLPLIFFPESIAFAAIMILCLGDSFCALTVIFERWYKRLKLYREATVEGTIIGGLAGFFGAVFFVSPFIALLGAIVGIVIEVFSQTIDDNLLIPVFSGFFMWIVKSVLA